MWLQYSVSPTLTEAEMNPALLLPPTLPVGVASCFCSLDVLSSTAVLRPFSPTHAHCICAKKMSPSGRQRITGYGCIEYQ